MARGLRWGRSIVLLALLPITAGARPETERSVPATVASIDDGIESFHERRLSNGLEVLIGVDRSAPTVGLMLNYGVGSALDPSAQPGLAQAIGRMLPGLPTRHLRGAGRHQLLEAAGFHPWPVEVFVDVETTRLSLSVPAHALELALYVEADRMAFAADGVERDRFAKSVEAMAKAQSERTWSAATSDLLERAAYGAGHPYARQSDWGATKPLATVDVRERIRRYYNPANATLALVGDLDPKVALELVERWFGRIPALPVTAAPLPAATSSTPTLELEVRASDVPEGAGLSWLSPGFLSDDDITLDVIARYLSTRLITRLNRKESQIWVRQVSVTGQSAFLIFGPIAGVDSAERWRELANDEIAKLMRGDVDDAVLAQARDSITNSIAGGAVAPVGRAQHIARFHALRGTSDFFGGYLGGYRATDAARVSETARRVLGVAPRAFLRLVRDPKAKRLAELDVLPAPKYVPTPERGSVPVRDDSAWYRPPLPQDGRDLVLPAIADETLKGGARLLTVTRPGLPTASVRFQVAWQAAPVTRDVWGAIRTMVGQTPLYPARPRAQGDHVPTFFRSLAPFATYTATVDVDELDVVVTAVPERVSEVLDRFEELLSLRQFSPEVLEDFRKRQLEMNPPSLRPRSWQAAHRVLSPAGHRYALAPDKARERLKKLTVKDVERYWAEAVRPEALRVAVTGPVDAAAIRARVETLVTRLPKARNRPALASTQPRPRPRTGIHLLHQQDDKEADLLVLWPAPAPGANGHAGAHLLRWVLGRSAWKALADANLRSSDDVCNYASYRDGSLIYAGLRVAPGDAVAALRAVFRGVEAVRSNDFPWVTFADARHEATQWVARSFSTNDGMNALIASALTAAQPMTMLTSLHDMARRYERATLVRDAALLDPRLATVIVNGRVTASPADFEALGWGPVTLLSDDEGRP